MSDHAAHDLMDTPADTVERIAARHLRDGAPRYPGRPCCEEAFVLLSHASASVLDEREACARVAEATKTVCEAPAHIAAKIRARTL